MVRFLLAVFAAAFVLTGCTKENNPVCAIKNGVVSAASIAVAGGLQCVNITAVQASLNQAANKVLKMCSEEAQAQSIAGDICGALAGTVVDSLVGGVVPKEWGCTPTAATDSLKKLVLDACNKI